ncbi:MAG TPA: DUF4345 domain-containing protein [Flavisolibacter sp.]|nr:DUF4345 domain-containing protein [Flavisolibacter sp.]
MKRNQFINVASISMILISALMLLSVSLMAFASPQGVMDLVHVKLPNTDAYSSIRGVYGGVGLTIVITLFYLALKEVKKGLIFLSLLWGFYAFSRFMTMITEGALGDFGNQWIIIEATFSLLCIILFLLGRKAQAVNA